MNNNPFKHLKNDSDYSLTESERMVMRSNLERHMRMNPVKAAPVPSSWFVFIMRPMPLAALALIVVVSSSSVSFAAGNALPGDLLYGVKVGFNEKVELALASSAEAGANARMRQAEERLRETEVLAVRGDLSTEVAVAAAEAVTMNVEAALDAAAALDEEGDAAAADGIETRIASAFSAHSDLLDAHAENFTDEPRETLLTLSFAVRDAAETALSVEESSDEVLDEGQLRMRAEAAHARAKERVEALEEQMRENGIPEETETELMDEVTQLAADLAVSESALGTDYRSAADAYDDIDRRAYRALTLLTSAQEISEETDQEVVIVLDTPEPVSAPVALRAKVAEPQATTMMMSLEASISDEAPSLPRLRFEIRDEQE